MNDDMLQYYNSELQYLRRSGGAFAAAHPKVAAELGLSEDAAPDPHIQRLIESAAFLNARIRHRLDDDFEELVEAFLGQLYPQYAAPIPSMAVVQARLAPGQEELVTGLSFPRGSILETERVGSIEACTFRTAYDMQVLPIQVESARLTTEMPPGTLSPPMAAAALRIQFKTMADSVPFSALKFDKLRLFLSGSAPQMNTLYELLLNRAMLVGWRGTGHADEPLGCGTKLPTPVGFESNESLLPSPPQVMPGYRHLTEYFAYPRKFHFIDFPGMPAGLETRGGSAELVVYLSATSKELEAAVNASTLRTGCTPVVNLFNYTCEPIELTGATAEYRVVPSYREPEAFEIHSITGVTRIPRTGRAEETPPLYAVRNGRERSGTFYTSIRRAATLESASHGDQGTEVFLKPVNLDLRTAGEAEDTLQVEALCSNRVLPSLLSAGNARFVPSDGAPLVFSCLAAPTVSKRFRPGKGMAWRLISHLHLNHLSLTGGADACDALREILRLYDRGDGGEHAGIVSSILRVDAEPVVARSGGVFQRGTLVNVMLDETRFSDRGIYLFASVLERFLGLYASINSFVQTAVHSKQRQAIVRQWAPRAGETVLL